MFWTDWSVLNYGADVEGFHFLKGCEHEAFAGIGCVEVIELLIGAGVRACCPGWFLNWIAMPSTATRLRWRRHHWIMGPR